MEVKNNYNECLTNLACSIRKNFGLPYKHGTIECVDKLLEDNPKNVVLILFDGMGSRIIDAILNKEDFFVKNKVKEITSVFPATTVAATNAIITGLNPSESGMIGWNIYCKDIDKIITTYLRCEKKDLTETPLEEADQYIKKYMITKSIMKEINEKGEDEGYQLMPFGNNHYTDLDDMLLRIKDICNRDDNKRKYIYAYDENPDSTMHVTGCFSKESQELIRIRSKKVEELCNELKDTLVIVVADHGHTDIDNIVLDNYPDIMECLLRDTSIEPRAVNFFIKEEKKEQFERLFNEYFGDWFRLYTKDDIIKSKLFGDGEENVRFRDALGDYLAIAYSNKTLITKESQRFKSHHAGYTDQEIYVPLILKKIK
jgi:predicted AlkP superfamily pyrophosphatase or phosphodiesterase